MPGVRDVRTLGWPLMVVVGVQDVGKDAGGPADRRTGGPADRRTGGPADRRGAWLPLMVGVGVLAGSPDLRTRALSRRDGRGGQTPRPVAP